MAAPKDEKLVAVVCYQQVTYLVRADVNDKEAVRRAVKNPNTRIAKVGEGAVHDSLVSVSIPTEEQLSAAVAYHGDLKPQIERAEA